MWSRSGMLLLVEDWPGKTPHRIDSRNWIAIWEGTRPAEHRERFRLYRRRSTSSMVAPA